MLPDYIVFSLTISASSHSRPPPPTLEPPSPLKWFPPCVELICWLPELDRDLYQWDWMDEWSPVGPAEL